MPSSWIARVKHPQAAGCLLSLVRGDSMKSYANTKQLYYLTSMRVYFGFIVAGDRSGIETARCLVSLLEKLGHEALTRHLVSDNAWDADRSTRTQDVTGVTWHGSNSAISSSLKCLGPPSVWDSKVAIS
jgi:hypothetical protein